MKRKSQWVSTSAAASELGCSTDFLLDHREDLFKRGKHWKVLNPRACRKTYRWHVIRCQKLMEQSS